MTHIRSSVVETQTRMPLSPDVQLDELAIKAEYMGFLDRSHLDRARPGADLSVTIAGQVRALEKQIESQRAADDYDEGQALAYQQAAVRWYDEVYSPVAQVIREREVLRSFPGRTEADLFLWLCEHTESLQVATCWPVDTESAADDLVARYGETSGGVVARARHRVLDLVLPEELQAGPQPGAWRKAREITNVDECLFGKILVPISGAEGDWWAVAQAAEIACRERAQLLGLHVVPSGAEKKGKRASVLQHRFEQQCLAHGVSGSLAVEVGQVARTVHERSRWADLVVVKPDHALPSRSIERLGCGFHTLIRRSSTPVLAVPGAPSSLERPLLACDGTPMSREALFVSAYMALRAQVPLVVVGVEEDGVDAPGTLSEARTWLERQGVRAAYVREKGPVAEAILHTAEAHERDLILMGGYGHRPLVEVMLGSTVDQVLQASRLPVLICR
jgi:nucleotide-binding universal stress UspA family protein